MNMSNIIMTDSKSTKQVTQSRDDKFDIDSNEESDDCKPQMHLPYIQQLLPKQ